VITRLDLKVGQKFTREKSRTPEHLWPAVPDFLATRRGKKQLSKCYILDRSRIPAPCALPNMGCAVWRKNLNVALTPLALEPAEWNAIVGLRSMARTFTKVAWLRALLACTLLVATAGAQLTVHVVAPRPGRVATSVYYEAYAQNRDCAAGMNAMRIYTAPHVSAFTVRGNHIETFVNLPSGLHNTVVEAWDNCGHVAKQSVAVTTTRAPGVTVFTPSALKAASPVHIAASAQGTCTITALRIYTAPHVAPYTIDSNKLNAFLTLAPGTYGMVAQAWDRCGHVYKHPFLVTVEPGSDKYLFTANDASSLSQFFINSGRIVNPKAPGPPPKYTLDSPARAIAVDPGGNFVYAITFNDIVGFQIDRAAGRLSPMPGSPFARVSSAVKFAAIDPAGHYLYVAYVTPSYLASYRINRSTGALTRASGWFALPTPLTPSWVSTNASGAFVYLTTSPGSTLYGFTVNPDNGAFKAAPKSPYTVPSAEVNHVTASGNYLYVDGTTAGTFGVPGIWGYKIRGDGSLTEVSGSPATPPNLAFQTLEDWFGRNVWTFMCGPGPCLQGFAIADLPIDTNNGSLGAPATVDTDPSQYGVIVQDHSGQYAYVGGEDCSNATSCLIFDPPPRGIVGSFRLNASGTPVRLSGPLKTGEDGSPEGIAVSR